jgi:hypothetical protein
MGSGAGPLSTGSGETDAHAAESSLTLALLSELPEDD